MKTPSERFHERMDRIRDADFAELDDQLDDPNYRPEPVAWRENGPDPFGVGWTWLKPEAETSRPAIKSPAVLSMTGRQGRRTRFMRQVGYGVATAAAACLLVGVGVLVGTKLPQGGTDILIASVTPKAFPPRGASERDVRYGLEIRSKLKGFATIVALAPGRGPVVLPGPDPADEDFLVRSGVPRVIGSLGPETTFVVFTVTETPAAEPIRKALEGKSFGPDEAGQLQDFLRSVLEAKGYHRLALGSLKIKTA
jgi:hypothetical protein